LSLSHEWSGIWLPIFPLTLGLPDYTELESYLATPHRPPVVLGLGNPSAAWMYANYWSKFPNVSCFLDYGLYAPNTLSAQTYSDLLPRIEGLKNQESWIQAPEITGTWDRESGSLPFFISRVCYRRQEQGNTCTGCPHLGKICRETWERTIVQGNTTFLVSSYRCWSIIQEKYDTLGP
jgi:hypothetical protein